MFVNFLLLNFLLSSGYNYSIDNLLLKKGFKPVKKLYSITTICNTPQHFKNVYFLFFLYYAFMSLGAVLIHVLDPYWYSLINVKTALVNSYLCKLYNFFRFTESIFPKAFGLLTASATIFQEIFQLFMIPLSFSRWGIKFVKWYGILFFLGSLFFLYLSYLPHIEFGIWFIIFFPIKPKNINEKIQVIYDDYCNLCKSVMRKLKFLNFNDSIEFIRLSKSKEIVSKYNLDDKLIKSYMVGIHKNKKYIGYDLYILIFEKNPLYYVFLPIFYFFKYIIPIGPKVYKFIAERRYRLFNQCELSPNDYLMENNVAKFKPSQYNYHKLFFSLILGLYFLIYFPYIISSGINYSQLFNKSVKNITSIFKNKFFKFISLYGGATIPNVFNQIDLSMGENFFCLYHIENGDTILVPITGKEGQRLNYSNFNFLLFTNHNSDILYFNTTLEYRRDILKIEDAKKIEYHLNPELNGFKFISKLIKIDYNLLKLKGNQQYVVEFYQNHSASLLKLFEYNKDAYINHLKLKMILGYDGKKIEILNKIVY